METPLCKLALKHRSDKVPAIHHSYTPYYYELLKGRDIKKILEIGIGSLTTMPNEVSYKTGASLFMWQEYFPEAYIYGIDISNDAMINEGRIKSFICDQNNEKALLDLIEKIGGDFDLIIDDGSHVKEHQIFTCKVLMPFLKSDGIYVIEDVEFLEWVSSCIPFVHEVKVFGKVGVGVSDNNLIIIRKTR